MADGRRPLPDGLERAHRTAAGHRDPRRGPLLLRPPPEINGPWFLWKLLIDHGQQGKGYGREVVRQIVGLVRGQGGTELLTSYVPGEGVPAGFCARLGFVPRGDLDRDGEIILRQIVHE